MAPMISSPTILSARAVLCRDCLSRKPTSGSRLKPPSPLHFQRRWIGKKYLQKLHNAEEAWRIQAQEIEAGTTKHLFDELQDRGLIKDVVG